MTAAPFAHPDVNYETMASELLLCFDSNEGRPLKVSVSPDDGPNNHGEIWVVTIDAKNAHILDSNNTPKAVLLQEGRRAWCVWQFRLTQK